MKYIFYIFWLIVVVIGVTFASLNSHIVSVNYYVGESNLHLPILLIIALVIGAVLGIIAMIPWLLKNKQANWRLKQKINQIEQEVNNLRAIPIKESH